MLTILGWLWKNPHSEGPHYTAWHANVWARMIHRNLTLPHRFVVVTDTPEAEFDPLITPVPLWDDWREVRKPKWGDDKPQCFVRLKAFSAEFGDTLRRALSIPAGDPVRFASIDLDCLPLDCLDPLFDRGEDFVIYRRFQVLKGNPKEATTYYQGSMWMMTAGAREQVWTQFRGQKSVDGMDQSRIGSDQAWISEVLGPAEATWDVADGVLSYAYHIAIPGTVWYGHRPEEVPYTARMVFFQGTIKPWDFPDPKKIFSMDKKARREYERTIPGGLMDRAWIGEKYWGYAG